MLEELPKSRGRKKPRSGQIGLKQDRDKFWKYCVGAVGNARTSARKRGFPFQLDAHYIDRLLVDQQWRCAVSGILLTAPTRGRGYGRKEAFGPSLDRIIPALGYVPGNVRIVCNIVNQAMNEWGEAALRALLKAMS